MSEAGQESRAGRLIPKRPVSDDELARLGRDNGAVEAGERPDEDLAVVNGLRSRTVLMATQGRPELHPGMVAIDSTIQPIGGNRI